MADVLPELPHMSAHELEQFLSSNAQDLKFTPQSVTTLRLRRRRASIARKTDEQRWSTMEDTSRKVSPSASSLLLSDSSTPLIKVTVLGDDTSAKFDAVKGFLKNGNTGSNSASESTSAVASSSSDEVFDLRLIPVNPKQQQALPRGGADGASSVTGPSLVQCWCPPSGQIDRHLRSELYDGTDCFIVMFSIKDRDSFESVAQQWLREAETYIAAERDNQRMLCTIPVLLVGLEAEIRQAKVGLHAIAVSSAEAVQLAQDASVTKYMEVYSKNNYHLDELMEQAVLAVQESRRVASLPHTLTQQRFILASSVFMDLYCVPPPRGVFDLMNRTFRLTTTAATLQPGQHQDASTAVAAAAIAGGSAEVGYWLTVDGSDPLTSSSAIRYREALQFERPFPRLIRIAGRGRCQFTSEITEFSVPRETPVPKAYFDTTLKRFVVDTSSSSSQTLNNTGMFPPSSSLPDDALAGGAGGMQLRYTTDGSEPTARSKVYSEPLDLDHTFSAAGGGGGAMRPLVITPGSASGQQSNLTAGGEARGGGGVVGAWGADASDPPKVIKLVAIGDGMFRSKVAMFEVPRLIEQPRVSYSQYDGTLKIEGSSYFDYRYTLDGSPPTPTSSLYTRPLMIPRDNNSDLRKIRVAAFPKQYFPSREVVVEVGAQIRRDPETRTIAATKTSLTRTEQAHNRREAEQRQLSRPVDMAPGSRNASPRVQSFRSTSSPMKSNRGVSSRTGSAATAGGGSPARRGSPIRQQQPAAPSTPSTASQIASAAQGMTAAKALSPRRKQATIAPPPPTRPSAGGNPSTPSSNNGIPPASPAAGHQPSIMLRREDSLAANRLNSSQSGVMDGSSSAAAPAPAPQGPQQLAQDNAIHFEFEQPITLSHITVATPGAQRGPDTYQVLAKTIHTGPDGSQTVQQQIIGSGEMEDVQGVQTLHVSAMARTLPIASVHVLFSPRVQGESFQIDDMKIHGKPFRGAQ